MNVACEGFAGRLFSAGGVPPVFEGYGAEALASDSAWALGGPLDGVGYSAPDSGVYDLSTAAGRAAWKASAPEGVERVVPEDGWRWLDALGSAVVEDAAAWLDAAGVAL